MSADPRASDDGQGIGVIVAGESSRAAPGTVPEPPLGTIAGAAPAAATPGAAQRARERSTEAVRRHPLMSLLLAAAAGGAVVWLLQRRLPRRG